MNKGTLIKFKHGVMMATLAGALFSTNVFTQNVVNAKTTNHVEAKKHKKANSKKKLTKHNKAKQKHHGTKKKHPTIKKDNDNQSTSNSNTLTVNDATKATYRAEALKEINALRASVGVRPLVEDPTLDKIADIRVSQNIARGDGTISHYDNNGNPLNDQVASQVGFNGSLGENLAMATMESNNPADNANLLTHLYINEGPENGDGNEHGHYENLVDPSYTKIGIGFGISNQNPDEVNAYDAEEFY